METNPNILLLWQAIEAGAFIGNPHGVKLLKNLTEEQITESIREAFDATFKERGFMETVFGPNIFGTKLDPIGTNIVDIPNNDAEHN
jgi:hypothetical protein